MAVSRRFDIPGFSDKALLTRLLRRAGAGPWYPFFMILWIGAVSLVIVGAGWRDFNQVAFRCEDAGTPTAVDACVERDFEPEWSRSIDVVREDCEAEVGGAYGACLSFHEGAWSTWLYAWLAAVGVSLLYFVYWVYLRLHVPGFVRVLRDRPNDVVWVYTRETRDQYGNRVWQVVKLGLVDGRQVDLWAPTGSADQTIQQIAALVPHASFGHSPAHAQAFARDPRSLRRY